MDTPETSIIIGGLLTPLTWMQQRYICVLTKRNHIAIRCLSYFIVFLFYYSLYFALIFLQDRQITLHVFNPKCYSTYDLVAFTWRYFNMWDPFNPFQHFLISNFMVVYKQGCNWFSSSWDIHLNFNRKSQFLSQFLNV